MYFKRSIAIFSIFVCMGMSGCSATSVPSTTEETFVQTESGIETTVLTTAATEKNVEKSYAERCEWYASLCRTDWTKYEALIASPEFSACLEAILAELEPDEDGYPHFAIAEPFGVACLEATDGVCFQNVVYYIPVSINVGESPMQLVRLIGVDFEEQTRQFIYNGTVTSIFANDLNRVLNERCAAVEDAPSMRLAVYEIGESKQVMFGITEEQEIIPIGAYGTEFVLPEGIEAVDINCVDPVEDLRANGGIVNWQVHYDVPIITYEDSVISTEIEAWN